MKVAIMQPYFMPYLGYWQLMSYVDKFVIYDNIEYEKSGWIKRNRVLNGNEVKTISLSIKKASDYLNVNQRFLVDDRKKGFDKIILQLKTYYKKAPYCENVIKLMEDVFACPYDNLFEFIYNSIKIINGYLEIKTKIIVSSTIEIDHTLKGQDKVLAICHAMDADVYINPVGGVNLYDEECFKKDNIKLLFLESDLPIMA